MPVVAEDGRVVPVIIESDLPMTSERLREGHPPVVDHNPDAHLAAFELTPAIGSVSISTRIKMKRTTWVRAIAETSTGEIWACVRPGAGHAERVRLMSRSARPASGCRTVLPGAR